MIHYVKGDVYFDEDLDIIYNPVGVRESSGFLKKVKKIYPEAFEYYKEKVWMYSVNELLGDIQVVYLGNQRCIMNGFCRDRYGKINKLAMTKNLVELCNLAYEYSLSVGIENGLGSKGSEKKWINLIIEEVFKDVEVSVYVLEREK